MTSMSWGIRGTSRDTGPVSRATEAMSQSEAAALQSVAAGFRGNGPAHGCIALKI